MFQSVESKRLEYDSWHFLCNRTCWCECELPQQPSLSLSHKEETVSSPETRNHGKHVPMLRRVLFMSPNLTFASILLGGFYIQSCDQSIQSSLRSAFLSVITSAQQSSTGAVEHNNCEFCDNSNTFGTDFICYEKIKTSGHCK